MSKYDGSLKFDTKVNSDGMKSGLDKLKSIAVKGTAAISAAVSAAVGAVIKMGSDFEAQMSKVGSISLASTADMEILSAKAQEMGEKTVFSATQAGQAFEYMAMAGWKTEEMTAGIEGIMNLAAASGEDLAQTSDIVTDALTAFGLTAKDSGHFADVLSMAATSSNTNVGMMGETFKYVAPLAGALGYSVEDVSVAIGLMANSGIKASQAGTTLRAILSRLAKPTGEVEDAMAALNVSLVDSSGNTKSFNTVMTELRKAFSSLTRVQKTQYAAQIAGKEAMSGMLAIVNATDSDFEKLTAAINNCNGATEEMANRNLDNLKGQLVLTASAAEGVAIAVYNGIKEPLTEAVKEGSAQLSKLSKSIKNGELKSALENMGKTLSELVSTVITFAANAIPKLISAVGFLGNNFKTLAAAAIGATVAIKGFQVGAAISPIVTKAITVIKGMNSALGASNALTIMAAKAQAALNAVWATNPVGVVVAALAALAATIAVVVQHQKNQKDATDLAIEAANTRLSQIKEETEAYNELKQSQIEQADSELAEVANTQVLVMELERLVGVNGEVAEENRSRVDFILNELNNAYNTEYEMIDGVIQQYQNMQAEIDNLIEKRKAEILQNAALPLYEKAVTDELNQRMKAAEDLTKVEEQRAKVNKLLAENAIDETTSVADAIAKSKYLQSEEFKKEEQLLADLEKNYADSMKNIKSTLADKVAYETATQQISEGNYQQAINTLNTYNSGFTKAMAEAEGNTKKQKQIVTDEFNTVQKALTTYLDNCEKGVEAFNDNTVLQLVGQAKTVYDKGKEIGVNVGEGMLEGINGQKIPLTQDMTELCNAVIAAARATFDTHSPSKEFEKIGEYNIEGLIKGTTKQEKAAIKAYKEAAKAVKEAFEKEWANVETNYELGDITEADKFAELERLRDKYFDKGTKEFVTYTKKINDYNEKALKERYQSEQKMLKYRYDKGEISEKEYYANIAVLRDKYFTETDEEYRSLTLDILNYEKSVIRNVYKEITEYATKHIEEVTKAQEKLESKLKSFGKLTNTITIKGAADGGGDITYSSLADIKAQTAELKAYSAVLYAVKQRVSQYDSEQIADFLTALPDMSIDELNAFNRASDEDFDAYMQAWLEQQRTAKVESVKYYAADMDKAYEQSLENARKKLEEVGFEIPEEFFTSGGIAAKKFGQAFCDEIENQLQGVRDIITNFTASIAPSLSFAGAASAGSVTTYNQSFVVGSAKNTVGEQISSWKSAVSLSRLRSE